MMPSASACRRSAAKRAPASLRNDPAAAGAMIEIFEDHPGIEQHRAVLEHERRDLAERILLPDRVVGIGGVGGLDRDLAIEAEQAGGDPDLADERRGRRATQCQHGMRGLNWRSPAATDGSGDNATGRTAIERRPRDVSR